MTICIETDGYAFHVIDTETNFKSQTVLSASQAGLIIERKFGMDTARSAFNEFSTKVLAAGGLRAYMESAREV